MANPEESEFIAKILKRAGVPPKPTFNIEMLINWMMGGIQKNLSSPAGGNQQLEAGATVRTGAGFSGQFKIGANRYRFSLMQMNNTES